MAFSAAALAELDKRQSAIINELESRLTRAISAGTNASIRADDDIRRSIEAKAETTKNDMLAFLTAVDQADARKIIDAFAAELRAGVKVAS